MTTVDVHRSRVRWRLAQQQHRRRVSEALDLICIKMYGAEMAAEYGIRDRSGYDTPTLEARVAELEDRLAALDPGGWAA